MAIRSLRTFHSCAFSRTLDQRCKRTSTPSMTTASSAALPLHGRCRRERDSPSALKPARTPMLSCQRHQSHQARLLSHHSGVPWRHVSSLYHSNRNRIARIGPVSYHIARRRPFLQVACVSYILSVAMLFAVMLYLSPLLACATRAVTSGVSE